MAPKATPLVIRFWAKVLKTSTCWLWQAKKNAGGYGQIRAENGKTVSSHRVSWELANGPIPDGMCVLHRCDVRACCRPEHLFLGTNADNMRDRDAKGRQAKGLRNSGSRRFGEKNKKAKLTDAAVREIRSSAIGSRTIAKHFGVSRNTIRDIRKLRRWKHVV